MRRTVTIALSLFCGLILCGGSLGLLQTIAWTGMLISRAQTAPLSTAIATTFDGQHPCPLCKMIQEQKPDAAAPAPLRKDLTPQVTKTALIDTSDWYIRPLVAVSTPVERGPEMMVTGLAQQPPVPPPRS